MRTTKGVVHTLNLRRAGFLITGLVLGIALVYGAFVGRSGMLPSVRAQEEDEQGGLRVKRTRPASVPYQSFTEMANPEAPIWGKAAAFAETVAVRDLPQEEPEKFDVDEFGNRIYFKVMIEPS